MIDNGFERMCLTLGLCFHGRVPASLSGLNDNEFGQVAFVFETVCSADCELYFMMVSDCALEANGADHINSHACFLPHCLTAMPPTGREQ